MLLKQRNCGEIDNGIDDLNVVFVYLSYLSTMTPTRYDYLSVKNTIWAFVAEEIYNDLIQVYPRTEQCKTIYDKLTAAYFIAWANLIEWQQK